jgi:UDP-3-O-[3-hydroxymyristoyl] glucosamine N-acyltransferase
MNRSLKEIAEFVQGRLIGDGAVEITGIASVDSAKTGDLVFQAAHCL